MTGSSWKLAAAAIIFASSALPAAAGPIVTTVEAIGSIGFGAKAGSTVIDFNSGLPSDPVFSGSGSLYGLYTGTTAGVAATPFGDATQYYSTGLGTTTITFDEDNTYLGLLWGSVDAYNSIAFYKDGNLIGTINGAAIRNPANGDQGIGGTYYVNFEVDGGYDSVRLISTNYSFEIDDLAYGSDYLRLIPEPAAALLLSAGLFALGYARRRRA
ncbi:MAG TPA: PEP-CTERM sorting domain-containing protein [Alphaproteobacteria bacterium]|nr:PEP-CTERM sorting domain-containing protein [Alphaproteobacteria bacterium]